ADQSHGHGLTGFTHLIPEPTVAAGCDDQPRHHSDARTAHSADLVGEGAAHGECLPVHHIPRLTVRPDELVERAQPVPELHVGRHVRAHLALYGGHDPVRFAAD